MDKLTIEWSKDKIIKAMEENMRFHMTYFARKADVLQLISQSDVTVVKSEISDDTFNYILAARFFENNVSDRVTSIIELFQKANLPFSWWIGQSDTPENLAEILIEQGLVFKEEDVGMFLKLADFQEVELQKMLRFEKVVSHSELRDFSEIIVSVGGHSEAFDKIYSKIPEEFYSQENSFEMYVGYLNDQPILSGILVVHADVAGIYYVATIPHQRRKGFGTEMMMHLLIEAKKRGIHVATLQASKEGKSLYERLGFTACSTFREFSNSLTGSIFQ